MAFVSLGKESKSLEKAILKHCVVDKQTCPHCHQHTLVQPGPMNPLSGKPYVPAVCLNCGYKSPVRGYDKRTIYSNAQKRMLRNSAIGYFQTYSTPDAYSGIDIKGVTQGKTFKSFKAIKYDAKRAKKTAEDIAEAIAKGKGTHAVLDGNTGAGKTHIAYSIINSVFHQKAFNAKIMFLDMWKLPVLQHKAIHDDPTQRWLDGILGQIGKADLVVLDDVGREKATRWAQMVIDTVIDERATKPLILTTNLKAMTRYEPQVVDRLMKNTKQHIIRFSHAKNFRQLQR